MEIDITDGSPRFEINPTSAEVVTANNMVITARELDESNITTAMQNLVDLLANKPGAIEVFSAIQKS